MGSMLRDMFGRLTDKRGSAGGKLEPEIGDNSGLPLDPEVRRYLKDSYPHNHTYQVLDGKRLAPDRQLRSRWREISSLYPMPLTSLLDLSCCKGYFVFEAAARPTCTRALGLDVFDLDIKACDAVRQHTGGNGNGAGGRSTVAAGKARFERMLLHELVERIDEFGGPFQTALLINMYQYLFFGSERGPGYLSHDLIFDHLAKVCGRCVIFSNRTEVADCQNRAQVASAGEAVARTYTAGAIAEAASRRFTVFPVSMLGRYPLWLLLKN